MTIASATPSFVQIPGNGTATNFAFPFKIFQASDLIVAFIVSGGYIVQSSGFNIANVDINGGGNVVFATPPPVGTTVDMRSNTAQTQTTEFANLGSFLPELHTEGFDRLTRQQQDLTRLTYTFGIHGPDQESTPWPSLPTPVNRLGMQLIFDPVSGLPTVGVPNSQVITIGLLAPFLNLQQSPAEASAGVTPANYAIPPVPIDPRRYGADNTGATFSDTAWASAIAVARATPQSSGGRCIYVNGTYKVHSLNFASQGAIQFNGGFTLYGDGTNSSIINIAPGTNNAAGTIGVDCGCMAYFLFRDVQVNLGISATNRPQVGILLAKGNYSGLIFSGIGSFQRCVLNAWGTYGVFNYCAENLDFHDCTVLGLTTATIPYTFSRVNTPGITSPNFTISAFNDSMTQVSLTGGESTIGWSGSGTAVPGVLLDIGTSSGIAGIDLGTTYFAATGATSVCIADNGGLGSELQNIHAKCMISEQNAGTGTQQVAVFSAATTRHMNLWGYSAFGAGVTQTVPLIQFTNPVFGSHVNWNGNVTQTNPTHIISAPGGAAGCIFQVDGNASTVSMAAGSQSLILAADNIAGNMGSMGFSGGIGLFGNVAPSQSTGWGTPTGGSVANNFSGSAATLPQTSAALAQVIAVLKLSGFLGT